MSNWQCEGCGAPIGHDYGKHEDDCPKVTEIRDSLRKLFGPPKQFGVSQEKVQGVGTPKEGQP